VRPAGRHSGKFAGGSNHDETGKIPPKKKELAKPLRLALSDTLQHPPTGVESFTNGSPLSDGYFGKEFRVDDG